VGFETVTWTDGHVVLLDQLRLPSEEIYHTFDDPSKVAEAIRTMIVRGAPAIGVTAALGLALAARNDRALPLSKALESFDRWASLFAATRPTAVNLFWAIDRMKKLANRPFATTEAWATQLLNEALAIREEDIAACKRMGEFGASLLPSTARVLTHCNAGALATAGWGTALGVIRSAVASGKKISVWVDETRPFLQGSRLTAWELSKEGIPHTLISDNMAGHFISRNEVDAVITGSDRIAANGDVANKIGTYSIAVLAKENGIPFYAAAPLSTLDLSCPSGDKIPIEERDPREVTEFAGKPIAPAGTIARHPAFDVTPARYVSAIVTEAGIARPPYSESLRKLASKSK
jgi:methylthioribose-1-phosphate isomerase